MAVAPMAMALSRRTAGTPAPVVNGLDLTTSLLIAASICSKNVAPILFRGDVLAVSVAPVRHLELVVCPVGTMAGSAIPLGFGSLRSGVGNSVPVGASSITPTARPREGLGRRLKAGNRAMQNTPPPRPPANP